MRFFIVELVFVGTWCGSVAYAKLTGRTQGSGILGPKTWQFKSD